MIIFLHIVSRMTNFRLFAHSSTKNNVVYYILQKKDFVPKESMSVKGIPPYRLLLPNLNAKDGQEEQEKAGAGDSIAEKKVIALAKEQGFATRKEIETLLGIEQTTCGRLQEHLDF